MRNSVPRGFPVSLLYLGPTRSRTVRWGTCETELPHHCITTWPMKQVTQLPGAKQRNPQPAPSSQIHLCNKKNGRHEETKEIRLSLSNAACSGILEWFAVTFEARSQMLLIIFPCYYCHIFRVQKCDTTTNSTNKMFFLASCTTKKNSYL